MITRAFDPLDPSSVINKREGGKVMVVVVSRARAEFKSALKLIRSKWTLGTRLEEHLSTQVTKLETLSKTRRW